MSTKYYAMKTEVRYTERLKELCARCPTFTRTQNDTGWQKLHIIDILREISNSLYLF